jgi:subtilisin
MNANPDDGRGAEASPRAVPRRGGETASRTSGRKPVTARVSPYMIVSTDRNISTTATLIQRLRDLGVVDLGRTIEPRGSGCPPIAVISLSSESATALRASAGGTLVVEADSALRAASIGMTPASFCATATAAVAVPLGPGFTTTIQVVGENEEPIERAMVALVGQQWTTQGMTDSFGKVSLALHGEQAAQVSQLLVKPHAGFWSLCRTNPELEADTTNIITLRPLTHTGDFGWGGQAMRFDQLPPDHRGDGIKVALIDSGVATNHRQLGNVKHGFEALRGEERSWSQDTAGHGSPCAGVLVAATAKPGGPHGYAPNAELHACKLPPDARCSDLVSALDYCIEAGVDVACVGFGCARGSTIVEHRIATAKQRGIAVIAASGSTGGPVQYPACSPLVLGVGAVGLAGTFPEDSLDAVLAEAAREGGAMASSGGLFVPAFSCAGPEVDLCAPGVAVLSCQAPDNYAVCDGTSLAAPHVAALAALVLAHRAEFRHHFANRDARRVEWLFRILKETAQPLGDPLRTGAGLPDAPRALGVAPQPRDFAPPVSLALPELRSAMQFAGLAEGRKPEMLFAEPPRGPAIVVNLPFDPVQSAAAIPTGTVTNIRGLKEAMLLAGLSAGT